MNGASWKQLWNIFWAFFKIGPTTFGGGYAMIPVLEREVVQKRQWVNGNEMSDVLSIAGSAPGGIGVNASAFIGYRLAGVPGASVAKAFIGLLITGGVILGVMKYKMHPMAVILVSGLLGIVFFN